MLLEHCQKAGEPQGISNPQISLQVEEDYIKQLTKTSRILEQSAKNGRENKVFALGLLANWLFMCIIYLTFCHPKQIFNFSQLQIFFEPPLFSMGKSYFCVLSDIGQNQKLWLSMVRMLLKSCVGKCF